VKKSEEEDFRSYVASRMDRWRRSAFLMCQDWHTADDVVAATVVKLYRNWRRAGSVDNRDAPQSPPDLGVEEGRRGLGVLAGYAGLLDVLLGPSRLSRQAGGLREVAEDVGRPVPFLERLRDRQCFGMRGDLGFGRLIRR
jgi:hypothetical protein